MSTVANEKPVRVVVPIVAGIGNALLAVPMVRAMKRALPAGIHVTMLARSDAMAEPFRRLGEVDLLGRDRPHVAGSSSASL